MTVWPRRNLLSLLLALCLLLVGAVVGYASRGSLDKNPSGTDRVGAIPVARAHTAKAPTSYLFAHDAERGGLQPIAGKQGTYLLRLEGVRPNALYFENRPGREVGSVSVARMIQGLFEKEGAMDDPPNAAVNAFDPEADAQLLMGVELMSADYDEARGTLTYRVRAMEQGSAQARHPGYTDVVLPERFGRTSVFIDTTYNDCNATLTNFTNETWNLVSSSKYSHDDWEENSSGIGDVPAAMGTIQTAPPDWQITWGSESGFARGCYNTVTYGIDRMQVQIYLADPYTGANTATCTVLGPTGSSTTTAPYRCIDAGSDTSGSTVGGNFAICSDDDGAAVENWNGAPVPCDAVAYFFQNE